MKDYTYKPQGVCPIQLTFSLDGDKVKNVRFTGGCNGNLKAISKLVDGMTVDKLEELLKGNTCGWKNTSCADQLAIAVRMAYDSEN